MERTREKERCLRDNRLAFTERFPVRPALFVPGAHRLSKTLTPCSECGGTGLEPQGNAAWQHSFCEPCKGIGFVDMPVGPTTAMPGTSMKISAMAALYQAGLPLYHAGDAR